MRGLFSTCEKMIHNFNRRKKAWEEANPETTSNTFEFSLIENVLANQYFTCAVEVTDTSTVNQLF